MKAAAQSLHNPQTFSCWVLWSLIIQSITENLKSRAFKTHN